MYDMVCKPKLDNLEKKVDKICDGLFGDMQKPGMIDDMRDLKKIFNDNPTLVDDVKTFKKLYKCSVGAMGFLIVTIIGQFFIWLRSKF
jgi:hypothetical protein